jgi:hypothetical protein
MLLVNFMWDAILCDRRANGRWDVFMWGFSVLMSVMRGSDDALSEFYVRCDFMWDWRAGGRWDVFMWGFYVLMSVMRGSDDALSECYVRCDFMWDRRAGGGDGCLYVWNSMCSCQWWEAVTMLLVNFMWDEMGCLFMGVLMSVMMRQWQCSLSEFYVRCNFMWDWRAGGNIGCHYFEISATLASIIA